MASAYDFSFTTLKGAPYPLAQHKGKPMLIVNTASKCGFTPQYAALQELTKRFPGAAIIGVPCNDFGNQEPGTAEEIGSF
jgi:glutathione peroxidase